MTIKGVPTQTAPLDTLVSITGGGTPSKLIPEYFGGPIPWVTPKDMKNWYITDSEDHITEEAIAASSTKLIAPSAVLVVIRSGVLAHSLPIAINKVPVTLNQDMKALRCGPELHPEYLARFLQWYAPRLLHSVRGTTAHNLATDILKSVEIPLLPLSEQKRIAAILDQADAIRRKRRETGMVMTQLVPAVFHEMFGDPVTAGATECSVALPEVVHILSGGTPSTSCPAYWEGEFPWVSPKDMKRPIIDGAEDHITELAFEQTTLKKLPVGSVLVVVRGMILAHTFPVAITSVPVAINQDMRALVSKDYETLLPEFLLWAVRLQGRHILSLVSTAAHGTKRLETSTLSAVRIPCPSPERQRLFVQRAAQVNTVAGKQDRHWRESAAMFHSLVQRAFLGEL